MCPAVRYMQMNLQMSHIAQWRRSRLFCHCMSIANNCVNQFQYSSLPMRVRFNQCWITNNFLKCLYIDNFVGLRCLISSRKINNEIYALFFMVSFRLTAYQFHLIDEDLVYLCFSIFNRSNKWNYFLWKCTPDGLDTIYRWF